MSFSNAKLELYSSAQSGRHQVWMYTSTDSVATVTGTDYFSTAKARGMRLGDEVHIKVIDAEYTPGPQSVGAPFSPNYPSSVTDVALRYIDAIDADGNATAGGVCNLAVGLSLTGHEATGSVGTVTATGA